MTTKNGEFGGTVEAKNHVRVRSHFIDIREHIRMRICASGGEEVEPRT